MKTQKKLKVAFDVDDTLVGFTQAICKECERTFNHRFPFEEVQWGFENYLPEETKFVHNLFRDRDFIRSVPIIDGAIELLEEVLRRGHEAVFCTSTYSNVMTERALYLYDKIPFIHPRNYIMTGRKDYVKADILFDDCLSHIQTSICDIPVLVNKPWNANARGYVRASIPLKREMDATTYMDIIMMAEEGLNRQDIYRIQNPTAEGKKPYIAIIVGGSGTGKSTIVDRILNIAPDSFERLVTNTSRKPREGERDGKDYWFKTKEQFEDMIAKGELLEYTQYANNYYGISHDNIDNILAKGKNVIAILDAKGVEHIRKSYPDRAVAILIERDKTELVESIMLRDVPMADKVKRIVQLDEESVDWNTCDYRILNKDINKAAGEIISLL